MPAVVPESVWTVSRGIEEPRRNWLAHVPEASVLMREIVDEIAAAASDHRVSFDRDDHRGWGGVRVTATLDVCPRRFDQFFSGRSGYRAQYYVSVAAGQAYNSELMEMATRLLWPVATTTVVGNPPLGPEDVRRSMLGADRKIWHWKDERCYVEEPLLEVPRWIAHWNAIRAHPREPALGLIAPSPNPPRMVLKWSWVRPGSDEVLVGKPDTVRAEELHATGWT